MDILPKSEQVELLEISPESFVYKNSKYYMLIGTDQADSDNLIYDFSLELLRLEPDFLISVYGEKFFSFEDMENIRQNGGYFKNWCY